MTGNVILHFGAFVKKYKINFQTQGAFWIFLTNDVVAATGFQLANQELQFVPRIGNIQRFVRIGKTHTMIHNCIGQKICHKAPVLIQMLLGSVAIEQKAQPGKYFLKYSTPS